MIIIMALYNNKTKPFTVFQVRKYLSFFLNDSLASLFWAYVDAGRTLAATRMHYWRVLHFNNTSGRHSLLGMHIELTKSQNSFRPL